MFDLHPACADITIVNADEGEVVCVPPRKGVALVGFGTNTRSLAPFLDPRFEIWGLNQGYLHIPRRADRWFEIHRPEHTADMRDPQYEAWLKQQTIPIYMQQRREDIPSSVTFPIKRLIDEFKIDYFTSSIAFMIALAISEGFQEIRCYGIDLVTSEEYIAQKPCAEWWLGVAWGKGIAIYTPPECALLKHQFRYGYEVASAFNGLSLDVILNELASYEDRQKRATAEVHTFNGAIQATRHFYGLMEAASRGAVIATPFLPSVTT